VDERRLYDVGPGGAAWTQREDAAAQARRLVRLRWAFAAGIGLNGLTWSLAGVTFILFGREVGAWFGVLAVLTLPLLALPGLIEAASRLAAWRRHRTRPRDFPGP
jgi:hypothetical protein